MPSITIEQLNRHIRTHTERSRDDRDAVAVLNNFFRSDGKIVTNFNTEDKWPNIDGGFELVPNPSVSRVPKQNFTVQIKGTNSPRIAADGTVKYQLDLAFPAYIAREVTLDPGILFVVVNPSTRNEERVFWKYISAQFIASLNFNNDTAVIDLTAEDELYNSNDSIDGFVKKLDKIAETHSYLKQLECRVYTTEDVKKIIIKLCDSIDEAIELGTALNESRDNISKRIFNKLRSLSTAALLLNGLKYYDPVDPRTALELSLLDIETKYLATFFQGLRYIDFRVPEEGQYERLMLKYYGFLWKIREHLKHSFGLDLLRNLEDFPRGESEEDAAYNQLLSAPIERASSRSARIGPGRYYVQKKVPFFVGRHRYFEITLQLASKYATKYNRLTVYSKEDISTNYSIQIACAEEELHLWDIPTKIKVVTSWRVSIEPAVLNKLSKIIKQETHISSKYNEYAALMQFLTKTGINLLDFINFTDARFTTYISKIYNGSSTQYFMETLLCLHRHFRKQKGASAVFGKNTVRYVLIGLREELLDAVLPSDQSEALTSNLVYLSKRCYSFELSPILYNLPRSKTNGKIVSRDIFRVCDKSNVNTYLPFIRMKALINQTGELYHPRELIEYPSAGQTIENYNAALRSYDINQGQRLQIEDGYVYLKEYVDNTVFVLKWLLEASKTGNAGQKPLNQRFTSGLDPENIDIEKIRTLSDVFVDSKVLIIYGAAGTGKTTLMDLISNMMDSRKKLFLAKTHTALENLQRRIRAPGSNSCFMSIDRFINSSTGVDYDVVFLDECSVIDNRTMMRFLQKIGSDPLLVLAGDIYQIESIDFGNWFYYAKDILPQKATVELTSTWRTKDVIIQGLWEAVRSVSPLITEMLVIDGPFSENIGENIFERADEDEVVLCLNYDGKFGLNSINSYYQDANPSPDVYYWSEWKYKVGDPILFNESKRFPMLYNNLKGTIVEIQTTANSIMFTIDIPINLTALDVRDADLEIVSYNEGSTRIRFDVSEYDDGYSGDDFEERRLHSIVPFQLAYAVSIHKAQGLEYNSIKVVIPNSNSERITHGIFYTAITRTKGKLKIFWSSDTMHQVIEGFKGTVESKISLEKIKRLLADR